MNSILIISHERSGWHFLANSIAFNSDYSNDQIDFPLTTDLNRLESFLKDQPAQTNRIYKSHHDYCALEPIWSLIQQKFNVSYLVRDGRDVMTSCFYYFNKYSDRDFFKSEIVGDMMRTNPEGKGTGFHECYWNRPVNNMADRWAKHVLGYIKKHDVGILRYESLYNHFDLTMIALESNLKIFPLKKDFTKPTLKDKCVYPRKGIIGDWRNHFNAADYDFFHENAKYAMMLAGYET